MRSVMIVAVLFLVSSTVSAQDAPPKGKISFAWVGAKPTPAQALEELKTSQTESNHTGRLAPRPLPDGPQAFSTGSPSSKDWPAPSEPRRLDGTLLSQPVTVYGPSWVPFWWR